MTAPVSRSIGRHLLGVLLVWPLLAGSRANGAAPPAGDDAGTRSPLPLPGAPLAGPPNFKIVALDCDEATVFAAGFGRSSRVPEVWVGELDSARPQLAWKTAVAVRTRGSPDFLVLSADHGARGARFALSGHDEFSVGDGAGLFESAGGRWVEKARLSHPGGERDILFGVPLLLRGADLFTFELAGGRGGSVHHFRRKGTGWNRSVLPLAPGVSAPWWQLAMSTKGELLAITTEQTTGQFAVGIYAASPGEAPVLEASMDLPAAPSAMALLEGPRIAVGLASPSAEGASLLLAERGAGGWRVRKAVTLPPGKPTSVESLVVVGDQVVVRRAGLWVVESRSGTVTHRLVGEGGISPGGPIATCGDSVLVGDGDKLKLFRLAAPARPERQP